MSGIWPVAKREFLSFFTTPVGYVVVGTYAAITGMGFTGSLLFYSKLSSAPQDFAYDAVPYFEETFLSPFLVFCGMLIMFIGPLITMWLMAGERHRGTIELLLTYPLRDSEIIFGKYLAALGIICVMILVTVAHMAVVDYFVDIEPAVLIFGLVTVFLMGAAFISLGIFISSLCSNPITAATMTFGVWFVMYIIGSYAKDMVAANPAPETWPTIIRSMIGFAVGIGGQFLKHLPLDLHAKDMAQGVLAPRDILYYILFSAFFLFLTFRSLESRKWRA